MGLNVRGSSLRNRNVAAVIVTADFSAGMDVGLRLDVTVSALGDATSLMGGTLLLTQLSGNRRPGLRERAGRVSVTGFDCVGPGVRSCRKACPPRAAFPMARLSKLASPAPIRRIANVSRAAKSRLRDGGPDHRRDQRLFPSSNIARISRLRRRRPKSVELFRPRNLSVTRYDGGDRRVDGRPGHGGARRRSTRAPARSSSARTCRSRPSQSPMAR